MSGIGIKSLAKETAIYGLSSIVGRFLNWVLVPLYTYLLTNTADYGVVSYIYSVVTFVFVIITYGMETTFFRFINKHEDRAKTVYSTAIMTLATSSVLFVILFSIFKIPVTHFMGFNANPDYLHIMVFTVAIDAVAAIPFAHLRYKKRPIKFASIKLINIFLLIILNIFFLVICPRLQVSHPSLISWFYNPHHLIMYIFISNLTVSALTLLILLPEMTGFRYRFDFKIFREMMHYTFPLLILGLAGAMNQTLDKLMYPKLLHPESEAFRQLGIYGACVKISVVMNMYTQAFKYAYDPFIFAQGKSPETADRDSFARAMKYFIIFSFIIFLGVMFYIDILQYFVGHSYYEGIKVVPITLVSEILFGVYFNLSLWYKLKDKTYFGAIFSLTGCVVLVAINVICVPRFGYIASAWASLFCNIVIVLLSYFLGQKYYPVKYDVKRIFMYALIAAVFYVAAMYVPIHNLALRLLYRTVWLVLYLAIIVKFDLPLSEIPYIGKRFKKKKEQLKK